jgi:hypothetical protein
MKNQENILVSCNISEAKLPTVGALLLHELMLELHLVAHKRQLYEEACVTGQVVTEVRTNTLP